MISQEKKLEASKILKNTSGTKSANKQEKGAWRMPRLSEAKKDVISCEKLRGEAHIL